MSCPTTAELVSAERVHAEREAHLVDTAVAAAVAAADWDWTWEVITQATGEITPVRSAFESMRPIIEAALEATGVIA